MPYDCDRDLLIYYKLPDAQERAIQRQIDADKRMLVLAQEERTREAEARRPVENALRSITSGIGEHKGRGPITLLLAVDPLAQMIANRGQPDPVSRAGWEQAVKEIDWGDYKYRFITREDTAQVAFYTPDLPADCQGEPVPEPAPPTTRRIIRREPEPTPEPVEVVVTPPKRIPHISEMPKALDWGDLRKVNSGEITRVCVRLDQLFLEIDIPL